jgi:hypothetical protein
MQDVQLLRPLGSIKSSGFNDNSDSPSLLDDLALGRQDGVNTTVVRFECRRGIGVTMTPLLLPAVIQLEEELETKVHNVTASLLTKI